ncbi:iron uptake system protein EfeO [Bacillus sp. S/N-304-OC-R1]|uniref:iron uptake system protein EfeO n=1 Tax=Bacillus sp. S/N-304-OC-R1 TaxID=2758034 RepID=UPI001C8E31C2|nr:iron uptake system protein EfeO [Bacillus sp. S/N-304-OC-R1]MBY0121342.1 EfeM/EfeO family lipoprotein [Bacillus sp. S/N-304-OC-R1]
MKSIALLSSSIILAGSLLAGCSSSNNAGTEEPKQEIKVVDLSKEQEAYKEFALDQIDQFVIKTDEFVQAILAGDVEKAKLLYAPARMFFERSEPVAESFGDLDPRIDARLADIKEEGKGEEEWSGYHKLEYGLWEENTTKGYEEVATQLLNDTKELRAKVETVEITPDLMITGAIDLLNEVSTSKISGEEEIYSHTDLYDFKANIEGAEKIFEIFKPALTKKDTELVKTLESRFKAVNDLLAKYEDGRGGYVLFESLTNEDTKALSEAVDGLGEPLSQMAIVVE